MLPLLLLLSMASVAHADGVQANADGVQAKVDADVSRPNPVARKAERMAMLDAKLLDDNTLGELSATAARERAEERANANASVTSAASLRSRTARSLAAPR